MNELQLFNFEEKEIKTIQINNEIYFVGKDICNILELADVSKAISRLDEDEKLIRTLFLSGQNREVLFINESGLYSLVLTSRKPEAKRFKKWVTSEVIPSIRKTGGYNSNDTKIDRLIELMMQTNSNLTALVNNLAIKHEPKVETSKYFQPSFSSNSNDDIHLYHRITIYGKKFRPDLDQSQIRDRAKEIGMMASRLSKERNIQIIKEDNLDGRFQNKISYYHQNVLKEVFDLIF
jgi:prophage antirepressor-like protein